VVPDGKAVAQSPAMEDDILYAVIDLGVVKFCHANQHFIPDRRKDVYVEWFKK